MPTSLIEVHEDRIRRLEDGVSDARVDIGALAAQVNDIQEDVKSGFAMVSTKLDGLTTLDERITEIETMVRVRKELKKHNRDKLKQYMKIGSVLGAIVVGLGSLLLKVFFGS